MATQPKPTTRRNTRAKKETTEAQATEQTQPTQEQTPELSEPQTQENAVEQTPASPEELVPNFSVDEKPADKETVELVRGIQIKAAPKQLEQIKAIDVNGFIASKYSLQPESFSSKLKAIIVFMEGYVDAMRKGVPVEAKAGANRQYRLLQMVRGALDAQSSEALINFDTILYFVNQNKVTVFNERLAARFHNHLPDHEVNAFLAMMTLLLKTASPRERQTGLASVQLQEIAKAFNSEQQVTNLYAFYAKNT